MGVLTGLRRPRLGWLIGLVVLAGCGGGGSATSEPEPEIPASILDAHCGSAATCLAVGGQGQVWRTVDAGRSWQRQGRTALPATGVGVRMLDERRAYALTIAMQMLYTEDAGTTWALRGSVPLQQFTRMWVLDARTLIVTDLRAEAPSATVVSEDGGTRWRPLNAAGAVALDVGAAGQAWTLGYRVLTRELGLRSTELWIEDGPPGSGGFAVAAVLDGATAAVLRARVPIEPGPVRYNLFTSTDGGSDVQQSEVRWPEDLPAGVALYTMKLYPGGRGWAVFGVRRSFIGLQTVQSPLLLETVDGGRSWVRRGSVPGLAADDVIFGSFVDEGPPQFAYAVRPRGNEGPVGGTRLLDPITGSTQVVAAPTDRIPECSVTSPGGRLLFRVCQASNERLWASSTDGREWRTVP
jgi:photosystem II stability/assembly factor-like uncharacterized protein